MLTKLTIRRFKQFEDVEIELGSPAVLIGPNDSGKTTALQALALWEIGVRRWSEKRGGKKTAPEKRPGVTINRRDLITVPVPNAIFLWHDLNVRSVTRDNGKQSTTNIRVDVIVEGVEDDAQEWVCGLEFDYANPESFYCRPLRILGDPDGKQRMPVPPQALATKIAFLPPMSGLAAQETRLDPGAINVRVGEGRTAEVLRNLCYGIYDDGVGDLRWGTLCTRIKDLFGIELDPPEYVAERGEVTMTYRTRSGVKLDLASSGRGMQQTLLLLAHLSENPRSVLLLDEPDAHLEILRQREIYQVLTETAREQGSQIIAASHSEVILNEAADRDVVVAFVGKPHRIDDRGSQVTKALREIGFDQYYQAEIAGWVLYLEGSTDLAILQGFAELLDHPAREALARPFARYVLNQPQSARSHFRGLREAKPDLVGYALFDRLDVTLHPTPELPEVMWRRREIESYLCQPETLLRYAAATARQETLGPLFEETDVERREQLMNEVIADLVPPVALRDQSHDWWLNTKVSDDFLDPLFASYYERLGLPNLMRKSDYHVLARHVPVEFLAEEITHVLDGIAAVARSGSDAS